MIAARSFPGRLALIVVRFLWLCGVALVLFPLRAGAVEPQQREVVVVSARAWDGYEYKESFLPSTKDEMTLMAGQGSAVVFVRTQEYYWPLSRQVYVDFERQRDIVSGELVIRRDGEVVAREALRPYAILYPYGAVNGRGRLLWGEEAERAYAEHQENERRFAREFAAARQEHSAYERRLVESAATRQRGEAAEVIVPPPALPEPSLRLVTAPVPGFDVRLEPGVYDIALEDAGRPVPETRRRLHVVSLSGREALVADIVPEERWTRPLASNTDGARIFARPGAVFYLTLAEASRFDEAEYLPVVSPQAEPVAGRAMWVRRKPAEVDRLQFAWDGGETGLLTREPLKVEQTRGSGFGYRVRSAIAGEEADLDAFAVQVPSEPAAARGTIALDGQAEAPFDREIVVVQPRQAALGLALALLPLLGCLAIHGWRRFAR